MSKQHFNSNETLEMCDVVVSQDGRVEVKTKSFHTAEMQRLGTPKGPVRGRMQVEGVNILFAPYAEGTRKPTFSQTVVVGSTSLQCTEDKVKVSFNLSSREYNGRWYSDIRAWRIEPAGQASQVAPPPPSAPMPSPDDMSSPLDDTDLPF